MKIGVLALQGAFIEHIHILKQLGAECIEIRQQNDVTDDLDGLILPGGESTVMGKLLHELDLYDILRDKILAGLPVLATCAGLILLASSLEEDDTVHFGTLPVTVRRNAYGRQLGSFSTHKDIGEIKDYPLIFIRAPYVASIRDDVTVLGQVDDRIVAVQYENQIGLSFHPELTNDVRIHEYFLGVVKKNSIMGIQCH